MYEFSDKDLRYLPGLCTLGNGASAKKILEENFSKQELVEAFSNFIGLAQTVLQNQKEFFEMLILTSYAEYPHNLEKFNTPTILGAFKGYELAKDIGAEGACASCAYRVGSVPNTCLVTVADCAHQKENSALFWCHHDMNEDGTPSKKCIGYMKDLKRYQRDAQEGGE